MNYGRAFAIGIILNVAFVLVEVFFGLMADSLALLADAGHNLSDVVGLVVAWGASWLSQWHPTDKYTYGFRRSSILAALINALLLIVAIGGIVWEAIGRLMHPVAAHAPTIIWVAAVGVGINAATALLFIAGRRSDLNIRGAYLHMAADAAISAGVVVAGILIALTGIQILDPVISIVVAAIIFTGTWGLLRQSMNLAIDAVPEQIDADQVARFLSSLPAVKNVHHLHIWGLSTTDVALTAHMVLSRPDNNDVLLAQIREELHHRFDINHATVQFESSESGICLTKCCTLHSCRGGKDEGGR
ncbi:MAG: cation diffusion facilitator family transporter [Candidatus Fermentibacter sp.]|nr:cation diffusion facilitator family transporter [Candidatus Fermentibacter sp.]